MLKKDKFKIFFLSLIILICLSQLVKFYSFFLEYSDWQYSDWLINYQGGFIRRGLIGEILFNLYSFFQIDLDILVLLFVSFLIIFNSIFLIESIDVIKKNQIDILIFLSPGFFLYPLMNSEIVGRKDILMIFSIILFVFFERKMSAKFLLFTCIFLVLLTTLSHSAFIFYTPYIFFLYLIINIKNNYNFLKLNIMIISSIILFCFILIAKNQGNFVQVLSICDSIKEFVNDDCHLRGQISWLGSNIDDYFFEKGKSNLNLKKSFLVYFFSFLVVNLFLGLRLFKSKFNFNQNFFLNKVSPLFLFILLFILTLPVYILTLDWGRYIYISYSCSFFIYYYCLKNKLIISAYDINFKKKLFISCIIVYSFVWTFPFYKAESLKFVLKKPFKSIIKKF